MGLDITAYDKLELVEEISFEALKARQWDHPLYDDDVHIFVGLVREGHRDRMPGPEGFYRRGKSMGWRAGSYGGYNAWRRWLAALVGTTDKEVWRGKVPPAFGELINFSDAEGTLGAPTCAKLAKDFDAWRVRAALTVRVPDCSACGARVKHLPAGTDHGEQLGCDACGAMFEPEALIDFDALRNESSADGGWDFELFEKWREGFHFAKDGGAVDFH